MDFGGEDGVGRNYLSMREHPPERAGQRQSDGVTLTMRWTEGRTNGCRYSTQTILQTADRMIEIRTHVKRKYRNNKNTQTDR